MSRRSMPYHRRYHQDALQGYRRLTLEERGAYTTILDLIYDEGGPIENNERWLAGELNCSLRKVRALLEALLTMRKLYITSIGKISNHRAEAELENSLKISRKASESVAKREEKRAERSKFGNKNSVASHRPMIERSSIPVPVPYNKNISTVDEDTEEPKTATVSSRPPFPVEALKGNTRLIDALDGKGGGRAAMVELVQAQRHRGRRR